MSKDYCDGCTELKEVERYEVADIFFYWCDECSENN